MKYFKIKEFACKHCGQLPAQGIDNNLLKIADRAREILGYPVIVTSGYRCPVHNKNVGGAKNSFHVQGKAADLVCNSVDLATLKNAIRRAMEELNIKGGLQEYLRQKFVHVDTRGYWSSWKV